MIFFLIVFIIIFYLAIETRFFLPKSRVNLFECYYTDYEDLWVKKEGNKNLIIFLHGMYSNPDHFLELAQKIAPESWNVFIPALPNSAKNINSLKKQGPFQWDDQLRIAFQKILSQTKGYEKIVLAGHSQGGALALTLAPSLSFLSGLIVIASPLTLIHSKTPLLNRIYITLGNILHYLPEHGLLIPQKNSEEIAKLYGEEESKDHFYYGMTLGTFRIGLRETRKNLPQIITPAFLIYEKNDRVVDFKNYQTLTKKLKNTSIQSLILETPASVDNISGKHKLITYIHTKEVVADGIINYLKQF